MRQSLGAHPSWFRIWYGANLVTAVVALVLFDLELIPLWAPACVAVGGVLTCAALQVLAGGTPARHQAPVGHAGHPDARHRSGGQAGFRR